MKQLLIRPEIWEFSDFHTFAEAFEIGADDLILTNEYIYRPVIETERLKSSVIFQEKYGQGEPTDEMAQALLEEVQKRDCSRIIAIGGGTIIDLAKALVLKGQDTIDQMYAHMADLKKNKTLVIVPTTCGTGSEVTNIAILNRLALGTKQGLVSEAMYADAAVLIPEFLESLPYKVFATSSIDALVHAAESYLSPKATPFTEMYSKQAVEMILRGYGKIAAYGTDVWKEEKEAYLRASTYAGIAFSNSGCAAVHAMSYAFGGKYHVPHGESNYQFFTAVLRMYQTKKPKGKIAVFDRMEKGYSILLKNTRNSRKAEARCLEELLQNVLARRPMSDYGAQREDLDVFAQSTVKNQQRLLANNYAELTQEEIREIYRRCL